MAGDRSFTSLGARVDELEAASNERLADAETLFASNRHASSIAMAIYAVEMRLKVTICRRLSLDAPPRAFEIHDLPSLLLLGGLKPKLEKKRSRHVLANWDEVVKQSGRLNDLRYKPAMALKLHPATVATFLAQVRDPPHGVLPWLSRQA